MIRILLLGPFPPPMGGDTRLFSTLAADLRVDARYELTIINTSRGREHSRVLRNAIVGIKILLRVAMNLRRVDLVSFHSSDRGMFLFGPCVVLLARIARKPVVLRLFGGSFGDFYESRGALARLIVRRAILCADVLLLQTRRVMRQLSPLTSSRLVWFSTYITPASLKPGQERGVIPPDNRLCSRFVFLGHLWRTKGIDTLLDAAPLLPPGCSIDIFGWPDEYAPHGICPPTFPSNRPRAPVSSSVPPGTATRYGTGSRDWLPRIAATRTRSANNGISTGQRSWIRIRTRACRETACAAALGKSCGDGCNRKGDATRCA